MKSQFVKISIGSFLFIAMIFAILVFFQPLCQRFENRLIQYRDSLLQQMEDQTGLRVSYQSLSPSILSAFRIKGIVVYDVAADIPVLKIRNAVLRFNFFELVRGNFDEAFSSLKISGIILEFDALKNSSLVSRLSGLIQKNSGGVPDSPAGDFLQNETVSDAVFEENSGMQEAAGFNIGSDIKASHQELDVPVVPVASGKNGMFPLSLPFSVSVRDVTLHYQDEIVDAELFINRIKITDSTDDLFFNVSGAGIITAELQQPLLSRLPVSVSSQMENLSASFTLDAAVMRSLDGSVARLKLNSINSTNVQISRTNLLAGYGDGVLWVSTIQDMIPFLLSLEFDIPGQKLTGRLEMDQFDPFSYIKLNRQPDLLRKLNGSLFSGIYELAWDIAAGSYTYTAKGATSLSDKLIPGGLQLSYNIAGNQTDIIVSDFQILSEQIDFSLDGSINLPTLSAAGTAFLNRYVVPGGGIVSAEIYIDPLDTGFICFIPQLYLGDRSLTALQLSVIPEVETKSADFTFEFSDYSHTDFDNPGYVSIAGSFINGENPFVQLQLQVSDLFVDSLLYTAAFFVPDSRAMLTQTAGLLAPYVMTNEMYFSSDFSSVTYNIPYWIVADTSNDRNLLILSFTGNENNINVTQFDLLYMGQTLRASVDIAADPDFESAFFTSEAALNSIPYSFNGTIIPGSLINISGSYGFEALLSYNDDGNGGRILEGHFLMDNLPVAVGKSAWACSSDIQMRLPDADFLDFSVDINHFAVSEISGGWMTEPHLSLSGSLNEYGLVLDTVVFNDNVSLLDGSGSIMWSISDGVFNSASLNISLNCPVSSESYVFTASAANPESAPFNELDFMNDIYFSGQISVSDFPMSRVRQMQTEDDVCSGTVSVLGTIENPFISVQIAPSSMSFGGVPFNFSALMRLEDGDFYLDSGEINFSNHSVSGISARFSLANFAGTLQAVYSSSIDNVYSLEIPVSVTVSSSAVATESGLSGLTDAIARGLPEYITADLNGELTGTLFEKPEPVEINVMRIPGYLALSSSGDLGISGSMDTSGQINLTLGGRMPVHADVSGFISERLLDITVDNVYSDLSKFSHILYFPYIALYGGILTGSVHIGGFLADPEFDGNLFVSRLDINCPDYVPEHMIAESFPISITDNELSVDNALFSVGKGSAVLDLQLLFDRWLLDVLTLQVKTPDNVQVPALVVVPPITVDGMSTCDLDITVTMTGTDIIGRFYADDVDIEISNEVFQGYDAYASEYDINDYRVTADIQVISGQHVEIILDPLLRGLIAPNTELTLLFDSETQDLTIKSDVVLRGGEVTYLNRNFYLREGRILMNESGGTFDPRITVRAEIRERDEAGESVRITLSAENQRFSEFSPTYSSSPPKSELEIMTMLGQAFTGDIQSGWDVLLTGVDYGFQVFVLRRVENALRDLLNFDIFSLRTLGLQKSLRQWLNVETDGRPLTISNFFDNTTVYIGKYFGSSIYADALFHFAYDETKISQGENVSGLVFQPEIGLEMDSPFGLIRWSLAPDIGTTQHLWVPATSISVSWKFVL